MIFGLATGTLLIIAGLIHWFFLWTIYSRLSPILSTIPFVQFLANPLSNLMIFLINNRKLIGLILIISGIYLSGYLSFLGI